ncbi:MAG TPA: heavy metal-binding domain-containing protein [Streptosporangiaceae bacterium]|nr:heavy metal-binding domain-containing protein [Streptosporangiaceae bacterium]
MTGYQPGQGLPPAARARLAEIRGSGTWGSALSTAEFAAIRSAGFEPVGQVLGAAVYNIGYSGGYYCPGSWGGSYWGATVSPYQATTQVSGGGGLASFGPLVRTMYEARRKAIGRMSAECAALGGHGVVGVSLDIGPFPAGNGLEFKAIGTAVRAPGAVYPKAPFTSHLSGQDFAKLIITGLVPVALVLGISIGARHDDWRTVGQTRWGAGNTEVHGYTDLVNSARHDARVQLEKDARAHGADAVVTSRMELQMRERECPAQEGRRDHIAEATFVGTAIASFGRSGAPPAPSLAVLSLDPQRRQAARVRLGRSST